MTPLLTPVDTNGMVNRTREGHRRRVFRKGLWGPPKNKTKPKLWTIYPEITAFRHAASDHAAVWVDLDL